VLLLTIVLAGAFLATAATLHRHSSSAAQRARDALVAEVQQRTRLTDQLAALAATLRRQVAEERDADLGASSAGTAAAREVRRLEEAVGVSPVVGPALNVTVADARQPSPPAMAATTDASSRVSDQDLQEVVNALWAAGAEAIAINGQRLSPTTAIRTAGAAILVDFRPLLSPYVVTAIGDPPTLQARFADSAIAARFHTYSAVYGLGFHVSRSSRVTLPAADGLTPRYAVTPSPSHTSR
jgi:uncharacterized protein YlxW (UPF0749 family)